MGRSLAKVVTAGRLANELSLDLIGNPEAEICRVDVAEYAGVGDLCFAKNQIWADKASDDAILVSEPDFVRNRASGVTLVSGLPRLDFARALSYLERVAGFIWPQEAAVVHPTARIGSNVFLGRGVVIGAGSIIYHNVFIGDDVVVGERCIIKSGAVIGEEGFGFERDESGRAVRLPHIGRVIIGNDVEVGALTTVCRGTLGNTVLRDGCKIDDHVHIAHNVDVGEHAFVIACAEVSGGVKIGSRAWVAPNVSIMNQVMIGADSVVGLGSVVTKSVPENSVVIGNPAKPLQR